VECSPLRACPRRPLKSARLRDSPSTFGTKSMLVSTMSQTGMGKYLAIVNVAARDEAREKVAPEDISDLVTR
jgi:hypothetical protein